MTDRQNRAEAARAKILASGNPDLINQLHLMEATQGAAPQPPAAQGGPGLGTFLLGGAALAGGAWLGAGLAAMALDDDMREAFAVLAEDMGLAPPDSADLDSAEMATDTDGGLLDGFGDIFDI